MTNENMNDNYLGENLRRIRKLYERKQIDIAACIGISVRQYRKMENDEVPIKDRYLLSLATCYSITIDTLREFSASTLTDRNKSTNNQLIAPPPIMSKPMVPNYTRRQIPLQKPITRSY